MDNLLEGKTYGIIGAGNIGQALIKGLTGSAQISQSHIVVSDSDKTRLSGIVENYGVKVFSRNFELVRSSDIIILAVKPSDVSLVLEEIRDDLKGNKILISVAAGITTSYLRNRLTHNAGIVRVMPNTPVTIGRGAIGIYADPDESAHCLDMAERIFKTIGSVVIVNKESLMDVITGLSGSGPAYFFLILEAFINAGVSLGLTREQATMLTLQTAAGSIQMAIDSGIHLTRLREMVSSPGGTTMAALNTLEDCGIRSTITKAVTTASNKSKELTK